jgi:hypothetical protein
VVVGRISWLGRMLMRVALLLVEVNEDGDGNRTWGEQTLYTPGAGWLLSQLTSPNRSIPSRHRRLIEQASSQ